MVVDLELEPVLSHGHHCSWHSCRARRTADCNFSTQPPLLTTASASLSALICTEMQMPPMCTTKARCTASSTADFPTPGCTNGVLWSLLWEPQTTTARRVPKCCSTAQTSRARPRKSSGTGGSMRPKGDCCSKPTGLRNVGPTCETNALEPNRGLAGAAGAAGASAAGAPRAAAEALLSASWRREGSRGCLTSEVSRSARRAVPADALASSSLLDETVSSLLQQPPESVPEDTPGSSEL
mmetsp:Transcript_145997/g.468148  ORF Transcript_145997/g.468148 Transcript_145997/m.468148 type:complete len:239 (+) Transcript_145997:925-1641(+)